MPPPQVFGRYQLIKRLATGGMAEVWLARETGIEGFSRHVVVKKILPHLADDPEFVHMFLNEAKIAARLSHPNIAQIYDLGKVGETYFIAMEYIHGEDLGRVMRKAWSSGQWVARPLSIRIIASACEGLHYAHTKADEMGKPLRIVHRDISPQNILVSFDGTVKVVDFGIAKAADQSGMTRSGAIKGKFAYMSPEQAAGKTLDARSDLFALGLVLYELLTGVRPLKRDTELATLQAAIQCAIETPSAVAEVPTELDPVVMKALARAADDRYRDSQSFQMALEEFLVSQRWVATSVQLAELMHTLFSERLEEEARLGHPDPATQDSSPSGTPMAPDPPGPSGATDPSLAQRHTEQNWEAPPAPAAKRTPAPMARNPPRGLAKAYPKRAEPEVTAPEQSERPAPEAWEAPPAEEAPKRRGTGERPQEAEVPRKRSSKQVPKVTPGGVKAPQDPNETRLAKADPEEPSGPAPRRRTSSGSAAAAEPARRRRSSSGSVSVSEPQRDRTPTEEPAPARRRTQSNPQSATPVVARARARLAEESEHDFFDEPVRVAPTRSMSEAAVETPRRSLPVGPLVGAAGAAIVLALLVFFKDQVLRALTHRQIDGQEILLTVDTRPKTIVSVRHLADGHSQETVEVLGTTPLSKARGVHVKDTLLFSNDEVGVDADFVIPFGEPGREFRREFEFKRGKLRLQVLPKGLSQLSVWRKKQEVGRLPGPVIDLYEGKHELEIRGPQLKQPYVLTVEIGPGQMLEKTIDLSQHQ